MLLKKNGTDNSTKIIDLMPKRRRRCQKTENKLQARALRMCFER